VVGCWRAARSQPRDSFGFGLRHDRPLTSRFRRRGQLPTSGVSAIERTSRTSTTARHVRPSVGGPRPPGRRRDQQGHAAAGRGQINIAAATERARAAGLQGRGRNDVMPATTDGRRIAIWPPPTTAAPGSAHTGCSRPAVSRHSPPPPRTSAPVMKVRFRTSTLRQGWLGSRVVSVLDSGAEGPGFKSQPRRCRVTVLGKLFTPTVPLFTKQQN